MHMMSRAQHHPVQLDQVVAQKYKYAIRQQIADLPDTFSAWIETYLDLVVRGVRSREIEQKIELHLARFADFFLDRYGHERLSLCLKRDVFEWMEALEREEADGEEDAPAYAPATVNNHLASLSGFTSWVHAQRPDLFTMGNPTAGVKERPLPALVPRTLSAAQVTSLKSTLDRLPSLVQRKGRRHIQRQRKRALPAAQHAHTRPYRDRAIAELLLGTGVRREELTNVNLDQVVMGNAPRDDQAPREPVTPEGLRRARKVQLVNVKGKGKTRRNLWLPADARMALADYLEIERTGDASHFAEPRALFLRAGNVHAANDPEGSRNGRLARNSINYLVHKIGEWHDAEQGEAERKLSPLHPHMLRHTFGFRLAQATGADEYELQRRLGHQSKRYIQVYTNPTEDIAAGYVEKF
jgi:integrase